MLARPSLRLAVDGLFAACAPCELDWWPENFEGDHRTWSVRPGGRHVSPLDLHVEGRHDSEAGVVDVAAAGPVAADAPHTRGQRGGGALVTRALLQRRAAGDEECAGG